MGNWDGCTWKVGLGTNGNWCGYFKDGTCPKDYRGGCDRGGYNLPWMKSQGDESCANKCISSTRGRSGHRRRYLSACKSCRPSTNFMDEGCAAHDRGCYMYGDKSCFGFDAKRCDVEFQIIHRALLAIRVGCKNEMSAGGSVDDGIVCLTSAMMIAPLFALFPCWIKVAFAFPIPEIHWRGYRSAFHIHMNIWDWGTSCMPPLVGSYNKLFMFGDVTIPWWIPRQSLPCLSGCKYR